MTTETPLPEAVAKRLDKLEKRNRYVQLGIVICVPLIVAVWMLISTSLIRRMAEYVRMLETRVSNLERIDGAKTARGATDDR